METDHTPLVPLLGKHEVNQLPARLLRFKLRLMRFVFDIKHIPGKENVAADVLSRYPAAKPTVNDIEEVEIGELYAESTIRNLPASTRRINQLREAQRNDEVCSKVMSMCQAGWPSYISTTDAL